MVGAAITKGYAANKNVAADEVRSMEEAEDEVALATV